MNGELLPVWDRSWQEVWLRLSKSSMAPKDIFVELVRGIASSPKQPIPPAVPPMSAFDAKGILIDKTALNARLEYKVAMEEYAEIRNEYEAALGSELAARSFFRKLLSAVSNEAKAIDFLESAHATLVAYSDVRLVARFRKIVSDFITRFSLRYELRGAFSLHATVPGVFTKLMSEMRKLTAADPHLTDLLLEFEEAFSDLRTDQNPARIKTSLQKQFNLLEALGQKCPNVSETTLGAICNQLDWPHATIKEVGKNSMGSGLTIPVWAMLA